MYEVTGNTLSSELGSSNPDVFTTQTVEIIRTLAAPTPTENVVIEQVTPPTNGQITVPSGTDIIMVNLPTPPITDHGIPTPTLITPPQNIPVLIFNSAGGSVEVEFNDNGPSSFKLAGSSAAPEVSGSLKRVVVGPGGSDKITIKDSKSSYIDGGTGNDTLTGGGGNDSIIGGQGNDSISGGVGNDTIVTGVGNDTVDGGAGFDVAQFAGNKDDYTVTVVSGHLQVTKTSDGSVTDLVKTEYLQFGDGKAIISTPGKKDAALAVLYETLFHKTADASGLEYWINTAKGGGSAKAIAETFVNIGGQTLSNLTDAQFIDLLYQNTFNRASDQGGKDYWLAQLASGHSRGELAAAFADIAVDNFGNSLVTTVGYVKIIDGLI